MTTGDPFPCLRCKIFVPARERRSLGESRMLCDGCARHIDDLMWQSRFWDRLVWGASWFVVGIHASGYFTEWALFCVYVFLLLSVRKSRAYDRAALVECKEWSA